MVTKMIGLNKNVSQGGTWELPASVSRNTVMREITESKFLRQGAEECAFSKQLCWRFSCTLKFKN